MHILSLEFNPAFCTFFCLLCCRQWNRRRVYLWRNFQWWEQENHKKTIYNYNYNLLWNYYYYYFLVHNIATSVSSSSYCHNWVYREAKYPTGLTFHTVSEQGNTEIGFCFIQLRKKWVRVRSNQKPALWFPLYALKHKQGNTENRFLLYSVEAKMGESTK